MTSRGPVKGKEKQKFLENLEKLVFVTAACKATGISRECVYNWRREDENFRTAWEDVDRLNTDRLKAEAFRRAAVGVDEPVFGTVREMDPISKKMITKTGVVGHVKRYSDRLMEVMLKARDPEYREAVRHDVNMQFVEVLVVKFNNLVQRFVPLKCPHCKAMLPIRKDIAAGLESMPDVVEIEGPKTGGS